MNFSYPENLPKSIKFNKNEPHILTKEYNHINLTVGKFDLEISLGYYYIDMREAFLQYKEGIFGDFDENGLPMIGWGSHATYSPVNIAQYGFIVHDIWLSDKKKYKNYLDIMWACIDWFENNKVNFYESIVWTERNENERYGILRKNWISAMTIGQVISFYLRMYQVKQKKILIDTINLAFKAFDYSIEEGGFKRIDEYGNLWFEEYASPLPSKVLNGFIYAIFGLLDFYRVTGNLKAKEYFDSCIETLINTIHNYDAGYWSYYDQMHKELVKFYYQKNVHAPQMMALYKITRVEKFKYYSEKWLSKATLFNYLFVKLMYRILPRWRKLVR